MDAQVADQRRGGDVALDVALVSFNCEHARRENHRRPEQCEGRPCVRGMRIRVSDVLELFAAGLSAEQIIEEMPDLETEDLHACLRFASRWVDHPVLVA
jgi:uncharacterized protein (DUF433 family)